VKKLIESLPPLLRELVEKGIPFTITSTGVIIDGFYKSGTVRLEPQYGGGEEILHWVSHDRYDKTEQINDFADLVSLNFSWWQARPDYAVDEVWKPHLIAAGYAEEETITRVVPKERRY
jgi:hypothetical protein